MRELKFRAWDKENDRMIYFDLDVYAADQNYGTGYCYIKLETMPIMQYTGLKDKNGKKIYEKDIVSYFDHSGKKQFGIAVRGDDEGNQGISDVEILESEVAGNVYENIELLRDIKGD